MLTEEEVRAVLAAAMGYDNRRPGDLNVAAWREASDIGRWTLGEAVEAVHQHYARQRDFLMPADVTEFVRTKRRHAPLPAERQIATAPPAGPQTVRSVMRELGEAMGWRQRSTHDDPELKIRCPHPPCRAGVGRPCGRRVSRGVHQGEFKALQGYHDSRREAAQRQETGQ